MTRQRFDTLVRSSGTVKSFAVGGASECERGVTEGQRKTTENRERHPVGAQRSGVRWRGSNTWALGREGDQHGLWDDDEREGGFY